MIAAVYDWSGFYIGANGGWGWSRKCWDIDTARRRVRRCNEGCHDATGGTVGGQIGYRWQSGAWVFGLEAQGNWADFNGSNVSLLAPARSPTASKIDAFGLFTGQVGYAWNNVLLYVKGGAAVTDRQVRGFTTGDRRRCRHAPAKPAGAASVGVGLEYGFTPNWSAGVEYDHLFMGSRNVDFT